MDIAERCPCCGKADETAWISTTNEWEYTCDRCDIRFNRQGDVRPDDQAKCSKGRS